MSSKKFKFVSPGVFLNEIDNSQLPGEAPAVGPIVIGRASQGPALQPVRLESMAEFIETFGSPIAGGTGTDVWREGNGLLAPSYAAFAAQAYLRNSGPINFVRLLGVQDSAAVANSGEAGYGTNQQAYAVIVAKSGSSAGATTLNGSVAAIFYTQGSHPTISIRATGSIHGRTHLTTASYDGVFVNSTSGTGTPEFKIQIAKNEPIAATATFTFSDKPNEDTVLTLSDFEGTSVTFVVDDDANSAVAGTKITQIAENGGGAPGTAIALDALINASALKITSLRDGNKLTLTQDSLTAAGNTTITSTLTGGALSVAVPAAFTGGVTLDGNTIAFNFNRSSDKFIRKVFNTNPTLTNTNTAGDATQNYWLGESFETHVNTNILTTDSTDVKDYAVSIAKLRGNSISSVASDFRIPSQEARTGWFFSQQISQVAAERNTYDPTNMQKLFKFHGLGYGESLQRRFKVSIQDIKAASENAANSYGSFTVVIRDIRDTDEVPMIVERFANCNLNPQSSNYIAKKIGDTFSQYDSGKKRNRVYGNYPNVSRYVRVEVNQDVDQGSLDPSLLPYGFYGPETRKTLTTKTVAATSAANTAWNTGGTDTGLHPGIVWLTLRSGSALDKADTFTPQYANVTVQYPELALRLSASDGALSDSTDAYFGVRTTRAASSTRFDEGIIDHLRVLPSSLTAEQFNSGNPAATTVTAPSFYFSLDDIVRITAGDEKGGVYYLSGSRKDGKSITAASGSWRGVLSAGYDRFTAPFYGGHDGVNIAEQDPFNNRVLGDATSNTAKKNYAIASVERAIDLVTDPEVIECNLMTIPGLTKASLTKKIIDTCEARGDALAVIDLPDVYTPPSEQGDLTFTGRVGSLSSVVSTFEQRGINSSYGCTYYPWVMIYDEINDKNIWVPPSVTALGIFANTEKRAAVWFAPAGFNRGGLTEGSAGLPVLNVSEKLTSSDRDDLYEANINPIASFPAEGIVVFGQKTLQVTPSALDRINVRRLMIFVKKEISRIANNLLFDQNVQTTWLRFVSEVKPFLESVKLGFGLSDFAVVLDSSTTTPDLVDRNIMYAKIFLKPARAIEFIAIDFVITNTGAAFED